MKKLITLSVLLISMAGATQSFGSSDPESKVTGCGTLKIERRGYCGVAPCIDEHRYWLVQSNKGPKLVISRPILLIPENGNKTVHDFLIKWKSLADSKGYVNYGEICVSGKMGSNADPISIIVSAVEEYKKI